MPGDITSKVEHKRGMALDMTESGKRILTLDLIRGVAVMGIFSVNVVAFAMIEDAYLNPATYGGHHGVDLTVWAANMLLVDGKMRTLFSMLFGASMLLVIDRAEASGQSGTRVHLRRMLILLGFGLLHYFLLWFGDILTLYALSGLVAVAFRHRSPRRLIVGGIVATMVGLGIFASFIIQQYAADIAAHAPHAKAAAITANTSIVCSFRQNGSLLNQASQSRVNRSHSGVVALKFGCSMCSVSPPGRSRR